MPRHSHARAARPRRACGHCRRTRSTLTLTLTLTFTLALTLTLTLALTLTLTLTFTLALTFTLTLALAPTQDSLDQCEAKLPYPHEFAKDFPRVVKEIKAAKVERKVKKAQLAQMKDKMNLALYQKLITSFENLCYPPTTLRGAYYRWRAVDKAAKAELNAAFDDEWDAADAAPPEAQLTVHESIMEQQRLQVAAPNEVFDQVSFDYRTAMHKRVAGESRFSKILRAAAPYDAALNQIADDDEGGPGRMWDPYRDDADDDPANDPLTANIESFGELV